MLAAAIIVFREIIEAGLIVGIVLAVTRNIKRADFWIGMGIFSGIAGACLVAIFANAISSAFEGVGQEYFNAAIMATAALMLAWHNIWMATHGREMAAHLKSKGQEVSSGAVAPIALAIVVGVAILREGSEVVLFLYGIAVSEQATVASMLLGGVTGLALGVGFSTLTYVGMLKIPQRYLFATTSTLITFLAAGMATQSVAFLEQTGAIDFLGENAWDTSAFLSEKSLLGRILHTLIGYCDQPSILQVIIYVCALGLIWAATKFAQSGSQIKAFVPPPKPISP